MCANFSLHYSEETFIVKLDHFLGYIVKGICQKRDQFLIVQSDSMRNRLESIFLVINNKLNSNAEKLSWFYCNGLIRIMTGGIPTYNTTYFKDVKALFDGVREVNCEGFKRYYVDVRVCEGKMLLSENYCSF